MAYPPPPYVDAVCGTPLTGEAITGSWWAYPPQAGLRLGGYLPDAVTTAEVVPAAGLRLGAVAPALQIDSTAAVPAAGLALGAYLPAASISSTLAVAPAGLLLGAYPPDAVGAEWLNDLVCTDLVLVADPESELVLVAAGSSDLVLDRLECL